MKTNVNGLEEMIAVEMKETNGGYKAAAYVWHEGCGPIQYFADALFNGGVTIYNLFAD